jgi:uncharacterized protein YdaU (DUF1376 family)
MVEDGAYRRLIDAYYVKEAALPADIRQVCRLVRATSKVERAAVASVLREFFIEQPDGWYHKRCESEIKKIHNRSAAARQNGLASAEAKRQRKLNGQSTDVIRNVNDAATEEPTDFNSPIPNLQSPISRGREAAPKRRRPSRRCPDDFEPDRAYALREVPDLDVEREVQKFRDWEFAKARSDWAAAWRIWVGKCRDEGRYARAKTQAAAAATVVPIWGN